MRSHSKEHNSHDGEVRCASMVIAWRLLAGVRGALRRLLLRCVSRLLLSPFCVRFNRLHSTESKLVSEWNPADKVRSSGFVLALR